MTSVGRSARALTVFMVRGVFGSFFRFSLSARKRRLCVVGAYSGIAAVPKAPTSRERPSLHRVVPPFRQALWASLPQESNWLPRTTWDVHRSKLSAIVQG